MSKERPLQSMVMVIGPCWRNFCSEKFKWRILATFGFNRPHSWSYTRCLVPCFWRSHYQPASWCRLATSELRFDTVGLLFVGISVLPEIIDTLKHNIREAIGEIQLHTINNVLKNWNDRVGYCMASQGSHLNEIIFYY